MKKDIEIPEVNNVFIAAVREQHEEYKTMDWNTYIINNTNEALEVVLIVSKGYDSKDTTAIMRHTIKVLPAKSYAKIEFLQEDVLKLNNEFAVTYFVGSKMHEKTFLFKAKSVKESKLRELPIIPKLGILAE